MDFRKEEGQYRDYDNLYAMYLLWNLGKYSVSVDPASGKLRIDTTKSPLTFAKADELARKSARSDADNYASGARFNPQGTGYNPQ
jgi:hypothetical protein